MTKLVFLIFLSLLFLNTFSVNGSQLTKEESYKLIDDYIYENYGNLDYLYYSYRNNGQKINLEIAQIVNGYYIKDKSKISINLKDNSITDNLKIVFNANERYVEGEEPMNLEEFLQFFIDTKFGGQYKADLSKYTIEEGGEGSNGMHHHYTLTNVDFIDEANLGYKNNKLTVFEFYDLVPGHTDLYELYYYATTDYREKDCAGYIVYGVFAYTHEVKIDELYCGM